MYWLPPGGTGNGLDAKTWAIIADVDESQTQLLLDVLHDAGIAAFAARRTWRPRTPPLFRIWVDTWAWSRSQDVISRALPETAPGRPEHRR